MRTHTLSYAALMGFLVISTSACGGGETNPNGNRDTDTGENVPENIPIFEATEESPYGPIALEYVGSIGSAEEDGYLFSIIRGVEVDRDGNVIVFDGVFKNIRIFSPDGALLRHHDLPEGQGPGEFMRASTFALSKDETRFYLYDMVSKRITILDRETFDYVHSFPLNETQHALVQGGPNGTIAAIYSQLDLGDRPLVHIFDEAGNEVSAFEKRHEDYSKYLQQDLQRFHQVDMAQSDSLWFLSFAYPYDVRVYDARYKLLRRFSRTPDFFGGTFQRSDFLIPTGVCNGIVVAGEQLLLQNVNNVQAGQTWVHAFDFEGRTRGELDMSDEQWGGQFFIFSGAVDPNGFVYGATSHPYPRLLKFKIVASEETSG